MKKLADKIVLKCKSNPEQIKKFINKNSSILSKELKTELLKRIVMLQGHF